MSFRNTEGKKISQLARSRTAQRRRQQSLGQNLLLYLRGNVNLGSTIQDFSMYDKKVLNLNQYSNHIKSYKAYLLSGSIYLQQAFGTMLFGVLCVHIHSELRHRLFEKIQLN